MRRLREYISSNDLKMHYIDNKLNIVNYDEIVLLSSQNIIILKDNKTINIKGNDLSLLKLLDSEILINGLIKSIEL